MPYKLPLSKILRIAGWRVTIYDAEGPEEPHVSIYRRTESWRVSLRSGDFLDNGASWNQIHDDVRRAIAANWENLKQEWNDLHGSNNPV